MAGTAISMIATKANAPGWRALIVPSLWKAIRCSSTPWIASRYSVMTVGGASASSAPSSPSGFGSAAGGAGGW